MELLIETLKAQHQQLRSLAGRVEYAVQQDDPVAAHQALLELGQALSAHLELEDKVLYPELVCLAKESGREHLVQLAGSFESSMRSISKALQRFLLSYADAPVDLARLGPDWKHAASILAARLVSEELSLYPVYDQLSAWRGQPGRPAQARSKATG
jgi:hypothetical protein